jgi:hypothetical protein
MGFWNTNRIKRNESVAPSDVNSYAFSFSGFVNVVGAANLVNVITGSFIVPFQFALKKVIFGCQIQVGGAGVQIVADAAILEILNYTSKPYYSPTNLTFLANNERVTLYKSAQEGTKEVSFSPSSMLFRAGDQMNIVLQMHRVVAVGDIVQGTATVFIEIV